jgi:hypothetical protein
MSRRQICLLSAEIGRRDALGPVEGNRGPHDQDTP